MRMLVDDAGRQMLARAVDDSCPRSRKVLTYLGDLSPLHQHVGVLQPPFFLIGPHRSIPYQQVLLFWQTIPSISVKGIYHFTKTERSFTGGVGFRTHGLGENSRPGNPVAGRVGTIAIPAIAIYGAAKMRDSPRSCAWSAPSSATTSLPGAANR